MLNWIKIYFKLFNLPIGFFVKSKSIPKNPISALKLDISRPIVYVLPNYSNSDLLILRAQCIKNSLPDPTDPVITHGVKLSRYIFISDQKNKFAYYDCNLKDKSLKLFNDYFNLHCKNPDLDVQIVPVSIMFRSKPDREKRDVNVRFGLLSNFKKFFYIALFGCESIVYFSPSISSRWIIIKHGLDKNSIKKLTRVARIQFSKQKMAFIGPHISSLQDLFKKLLSSKEISRALEHEVFRKNISKEKAKRNALNLMKEIAANFSYKIVRLTDRVLSFVWNRIYQGIYVRNVERVQKLAYSGHEIVYIPCHRSHMDYFLLSYVIYHQSLVPPHIAAGINLNFWPIGLIFRRLGAFFIRRTFKNNKLYSIVLYEYLRELFNRGYPIEYFVEGGRSRTGFLLNPKTGILSMTIQTVLRGGTRPIALIPIYIGYEQIVEVKTYVKELQGAIKKKENFFQILRSIKKLRNLGDGYINFGKPLILIKWLNQNFPEWKQSINSIEFKRPSWMTSIANSIAIDLMIRINDAGVINAFNLCCTALLASKNYSLTRTNLTKQLNCYLDLMRHVPYSTDATFPVGNTNLLIDHAIKIGNFKIKQDKIDEIIILPSEEVNLFTYYRNNIIHMLVLPSILATFIIKHQFISRKEIINQIQILYPMLKADLFLHWKKKLISIEVNKIIEELLRQKLIILNNHKLQVDPSHFFNLYLLSENVHNKLYRYTIIFYLLKTNVSINRVSLEKNIKTLAKYLSVYHKFNIEKFFEKEINILIIALREEGYINENGFVNLKKTIETYQFLSKLIEPGVRLIIESFNKINSKR